MLKTAVYDSGTPAPDFFGYDTQSGLQYRGRLDGTGMGDPADRVAALVNALRPIVTTGQDPQTPPC